MDVCAQIRRDGEQTACNIVFRGLPNLGRIYSCIYCCDFFLDASMRISLLLSAVLTLLAAASAAAQTNLEIGVGLSLTRDNEDTPALMVAWQPPWREAYGGLLRADVGGIYLRGRADSRYDNAQNVRIVHAGLRYERSNGLTVGFGIGLQHGQTDALSGDPQFISSIGWRWNRVSLLLRHISNAGLHNPNEGENILQLGWRL